MLAKILRNKKQISRLSHLTRSGHWDHPDVPLNVQYVKKRKYNIFETNMWHYCDLTPEYGLSNPEIPLFKNHKEMFWNLFVAVMGLTIPTFIIVLIFKKFLVSSVSKPIKFYDKDDNTIKFYSEAQAEKLAIQPDFMGTGLNSTYDVFGFGESNPSYLGYMKTIEKEMTFMNQMIAEGNSYILTEEAKALEKAKLEYAKIKANS